MSRSPALRISPPSIGVAKTAGSNTLDLRREKIRLEPDERVPDERDGENQVERLERAGGSAPSFGEDPGARDRRRSAARARMARFAAKISRSFRPWTKCWKGRPSTTRSKSGVPSGLRITARPLKPPESVPDSAPMRSRRDASLGPARAYRGARGRRGRYSKRTVAFARLAMSSARLELFKNLLFTR